MPFYAVWFYLFRDRSMSEKKHTERSVLIIVFVPCSLGSKLYFSFQKYQQFDWMSRASNNAKLVVLMWWAFPRKHFINE